MKEELIDQQMPPPRMFPHVNGGGEDTDDFVYVKELMLAATNDGEIYKSCAEPCINTLRKKLKRGMFDETLAPKIFEHRFLALARDLYYKETGFKKYRLSAKEKQLFAQLVYEHYYEEIHGEGGEEVSK